ncbi:ATP-binding protein [Streptomyces sp. URMC 123]|uniref:ATP-binding protein n=1 Tax=Streptomyces sp. URMC 123 TaxID=3423403 RepID=UPI003F1A4CAC
MDPKSRGPEEHGHDRHHDDGVDGHLPEAGEEHTAAADRPGPADRDVRDLHDDRAARDDRAAGESERERGDASGAPQRPHRDPLIPDLTGSARPALARTVQLVAGDQLLTVNPVDGSEVEACPPGERPGRPERRGPEDRADQRRAGLPPVPVGPAAEELPLLERGEERERLVRLLSRGRSVRLTGPAGSGRSALLDMVAADCADLAPDGVIRLSGHRRTTTDLLHELFAAVHHAPLYRPDPERLRAAVREIGAVVLVDDLDFGGSALDELLDATPECAFLISTTPEVPAPSSDCHLEEVFLTGLSRAACVELLERSVQRTLTDRERDWAADLWFESEGLPLRFVQAAALLRQRDALAAGREAVDEYGVFAKPPADGAAAQPEAAGQDAPLPSLAEAAAPAPLLAARLSEAAREALRFAVALGGECPHPAHLPALTGDTHADAALGELLGCGLVTPVGSHYRLAAGVVTQLEAAGYADGAAERADAIGRHYAWWAGHPSVTPERVAVEADAVLAALAALVATRTAGRPTGAGAEDDGQSTAVQLARTAAPAFAAALCWGAWERTLRHGQEAARLAGEVGDEAYFHHELGVLALCEGNLERARAELEASIGLRGALADRRGAVAGRRALALVADREAGFLPGVGPAAAEEVSGARNEASASPADGPTAPLPLTAAGPDETATVVNRAVAARPAAGVGPAARRLAQRLGIRRATLRASAFKGTRRNMIAAGSGALLAIVLGTVVTLGATSGGGNDAPPDRVTSDQSANEDRGNGGLTADEPGEGSATSRQRPAAGPGGTGRGGKAPGPSGHADPTGGTRPGESTAGGPGGSPSPTGGATSGTGGSPSGSGGSTTGSPTSGGSTTGSPTGSGGSTTGSPTSGGSTTGSPTSSGGSTTGSPTSGGSTTGSPTSSGGSTTGSPTSGGSTTGSPTSSGGSTTGSPGTSGTTGSTTTGGTTGETGSGATGTATGGAANTPSNGAGSPSA